MKKLRCRYVQVWPGTLFCPCRSFHRVRACGTLNLDFRSFRALKKATGFAWKHSCLIFFICFVWIESLRVGSPNDKACLVNCSHHMGHEVQHDWLLVKDVDLNLVVRAMGRWGD